MTTQKPIIYIIHIDQNIPPHTGAAILEQGTVPAGDISGSEAATGCLCKHRNLLGAAALLNDFRCTTAVSLFLKWKSPGIDADSCYVQESDEST